MAYDYTEAPPQREIELIPHGTVATVSLKIRAGGAGEGGLLKRSAKGDCEMLDLEFAVVDGPYVTAQVLGIFDFGRHDRRSRQNLPT